MKRSWFLLFLWCIWLSANGQIRVWTVGDSTVESYDESYYPRMGWGQVLQDFFVRDSVQVINKAIGGTSSKSFYKGAWSAVRKQLKTGDFVLINFGINDRAKDDRSAPAGKFEEYLTAYVEEARQQGATPVLLTSIRRNLWLDGSPYASYHEHPQLVRDLAAKLRVPCIDLDSFTLKLMEDAGKEYTTRHLYCRFEKGEYQSERMRDGADDNIHTQETGAQENALFIVECIEKSDNEELKRLANSTKPRRTIEFFANDSTKMATISRKRVLPEGARLTLKTIPEGDNLFLYWKDKHGNIFSQKSLDFYTVGSEDESFTAVYAVDDDPVEEVRSEGVEIAVRGRTVYLFNNTNEDADVRVYGANGALVGCFKAIRKSIKTFGIGVGVYVVRTGKNGWKVVGK